MIIALVTDWISTIMNINAEYGIMYGLREIPIFFYHEWKPLPNRVKIVAESPHSWQKIGFHGNLYIILFLTRYFMPWAHKTETAKTFIGCSVRYFHQGRCDVITLYVTRERELLSLRHHIHRLFLQATIGAKAFFINEYNNHVKIDFPPCGIHGLACKNTDSLLRY